MKPHERPLTVDAFVATTRFRADLVIAKGQYSPNPHEVERVLLFSIHASRLRKQMDGWMTPLACEELVSKCRELGDVFVADSDAMYASEPRYVWAEYGDETWLWRRGALIARFGVDASCIRTRIPLHWARIQSCDVASVHGFISPGWVRRGVSLRLHAGRDVVVAAATEIGVALDPTYDGLDLLSDSNWIHDLARSVSHRLRRPVTLDESLR